MEKGDQRNAAYDMLRIVAAFSVVMLHCAAQFWYELPLQSLSWKVANGYDAVFRFGVPIFVMISGALFLGREKQPETKRLWKRNVLRMLILYGVWSSIYGLADCAGFGFRNLTVKQVIKEMLSGRYHLWFLPMIAGIYMLCPILYQLVHRIDRAVLEYFLGLFFFFQVIRSTLAALLLNPELQHLLKVMELPMVCSYLGYFILGYYFSVYEVPERLKKLLWILVLPAAGFNIAASTWYSLRTGEASGASYDSFCIGTFVMVLLLFLEIKKRGMRISPKGAKLLSAVSESTLGVYLMHIGVLELLKPLGIHTMMLPIGIGIPVMGLLVFAGCLIVAAVLRRIPVIGRYLC